MVKRMFLMLGIMAVLIAGLAFLKYRQVQQAIAQGALKAPPPPAVSTVRVQAQQWQPVLTAVGSMKAVHGVNVSTDLAGIVSEILFESGAQVHKGDLLLKLDTLQEEAQLRSGEARLDLARLDIDRKRDLVQKKAIATSDLDTAESELRRSVAQVEEQKALIGRKRISAPFDGVIGIRQVNPGQYINPGSTVTSLQSLDPIYVEFALPQQHLPVLTPGKKLRLHFDGMPESFSGEITAVESRVDEATRNITVQGTVANPKQTLRPGMFADVEVILEAQDDVLAIPATAVNFMPYSNSVYVIRPAPDAAAAKTPTLVEQKSIKTGPRRGDLVQVLSGLKAGDEIVISAPFRLRPNTPVRVQNERPQPSQELHPQPSDT